MAGVGTPRRPVADPGRSGYRRRVVSDKTHAMAALVLGATMGSAGCFGDAPTVPSESSTGGDSTTTSGVGESTTDPLETTTTTTADPSTSTGAADETGTTSTTDDPSTGSAIECGNGEAEEGEDCDGEDWAGATCETLGYVPGRLVCNDTCTFDVSGCTPPGMVLVPAGEFEMGSNSYPEEQPIRMVELSTFYLDRHEVTVAEYRECVMAGECEDPMVGGSCNYDVAGQDAHPMNCVNWFDAEAYCAWVDGGVKRLPTEAEWEKAARGEDMRTYPWGNAPVPSCTHAIMNDGGQGCGTDSTWMVGSRPMGVSAYGGLDMAGNVWEWVSDYYAPYDPGEIVDPTGPAKGMLRILRGGGWFHSDSADFTTTHRHEVQAGLGDPYIGIRCARPGS